MMSFDDRSVLMVTGLHCLHPACKRAISAHT